MRLNTRAKTGLVAGMALMAAACGGTSMKTRSVSFDKGMRAGEPVNTWTLHRETAPNIVWESGIAWDPGVRQIVWHGGHVGRLYPQSNYTFLYEPARNRFFESQAPARPQRRCLVHVAYLDAPARVVTTDGGSSHGSIPGGAVSGDSRNVHRGDPRGPWLYDAAADTWEDCRTLPPVWQRGAHGSIAYEPGSDALFALRGDRLVVFLPHLNRVFFRDLPAGLHRRLGYGMTADPIRRQLIVFGGSAGGGYQWGEPREDQSRDEARREAYEKMVKADTWIYDIAADQWRELDFAEKKQPPRGLPMSGMRSLQLAWHDASGTVLLMQDATDEAVAPHLDWPPARLWRFDPESETWAPLDIRPDRNGRQPAFMGLIAYDREDDRLWVFGGGRDGAEGERDPYMPAGRSRLVWSCRVSVSGRETAAAPAPVNVRATVAGTSVRIEWSAQSGMAYDVYRAPADLVPGIYERITEKPLAAGMFEDRQVEPGKIYAWQVAVSGSDRRSAPVFNRPWRPAGLRVSVESERDVRLFWQANRESDVVGYRVYRTRGGPVDGVSGELLARDLATEPRFADGHVDLSDGVIRTYWVTAVNRAGIESGASPLAYTAPDAPASLAVPEGVGPSNWDGERLNYVIGWEWPDAVRVAGFNVYGASDVPNGYGTVSFDQVWTKLTDTPVVAREFVYALGEQDRGHRYFHVRAVNVLGQEGFYTDIVSPTDRRFRP